MLEAATVGMAMIGVGVVIMIFGLARSGVMWEDCAECKNPLVHGYEARVDDKSYCRPCCHKLKIRPWYWKDYLGEPWK